MEEQTTDFVAAQDEGGALPREGPQAEEEVSPDFLAALKRDDRPQLRAILLGPHGRAAANYLLERYSLYADVAQPSQIGHFLLLDAGTPGGFAVVYQAWNVELKRVVALKISRHGADDAAVARFLEEAQIVARLHHPNIIPIHEFSLWNGTPYFTMPWCERGCLQRQPPADAARVMLAVAAAVAYGHTRGVWHMDLKPSNILLDARGEPLVADFGLALRSDEVGGVLDGRRGTPRYMAPEQAAPERQAISAATDVYGLGAVLYFLLIGQPPVPSGATQEETMRRAAVEARPSPRALNPAVPLDLDAICRKCLDLDPSRRYPTADALTADLQAWLTYRPTGARPPGWGRRLALGCWREPWWAVGLVIAAIVVALSGVIAYQRTEQAREQTVARQRAEFFRDLGAEPMRPPLAGWRERGLDRVRGWTGRHPGPDPELRDRVIDLLTGVDALLLAVRTQRDDLEASSVAFGPDPQQSFVLLGGMAGGRQPTRLWAADRDEVRPLIALGPGPVGFRDGRPIQLAAPDGSVPELWDLEAGRPLLRLAFASPTGGPLGVFPTDVPALAMTAGGVCLAAANGAAVAVWEGRTGRLLLERPGQAPRTMALSPDGQQLALAEQGGTVRVVAVGGGPELAIASPQQADVHCLAFDPTGQRLAVGYPGSAAVFRLDTGQVAAHCQGGYFDPSALAWSANGAMLFVASSPQGRVFDGYTGQALLEIPSGDATAAGFSEDGRLVLTVRRKFGTLAPTRLWQLEAGRGLLTLPGLIGFTQLVAVDGGGTRLAVMTHTWQVSVFDLMGGGLRWTRPVPHRTPAETADNCALAFGPDGTLLLASDRRATLWGPMGEVAAEWKLASAGVVNAAMPADDGGWLLLRAEGGSGRRVAVLWSLRPGSNPVLVSQWPTTFRRITRAVASPRGDRFFFFACGDGRERRVIAVSRAGTLLWEVRADQEYQDAGPEVDAAGRMLFVRGEGDSTLDSRETHRLDPETGASLGRTYPAPLCYSQDAEIGLFPVVDPSSGVYRQARVASLGAERERFRVGPVLAIGQGWAVSADGNRIVFPAARGGAVVCVVPEVLRQLKALGLSGP